MSRHALACLVLLSLATPHVAGGSQAGAPREPLADVDRAVAAAEANLQAGELQAAESHFREALASGWLVLGSLEAAENRLVEARDAFRRASTFTVDAAPALRALALADLRLGNAEEAIVVLSRLARAAPTDTSLRRELAQALVAVGRPAEAVQELEEAHGGAPQDLELTFLLASGYLRLKKHEAAERLFAKLTGARPIAETHVLIGRTYRDAGEYARARRELEAAIQKDARVKRAHYYLGTIEIMSEGITRLDPAIAAFERELQLSPGDPPTSLGLGLALVHARRHAEALPHLERAVTSEPLQGNAFYYLGRCLLGLGRAADAAAALRRSLELTRTRTGAVEAKNVHYQLGLALRALGRVEEAAAHFTEAERAWDGRLAGDRERLSRYLADTPEPQAGATVAATLEGRFPFADLSREARAAVSARVRRALAGAYLNVGIMHAQGGRFSRAAEFMEGAAGLEPEFPRVQYSLGVAYFNANDFRKATAPLERALAAAPQDADVRRMLALSFLNTEAYERAAALLDMDPRRDSDPSLQYAYGVALARSGRGADAEAIFARLLAAHGDRAELHVVLGQGHAQQGDMDAAVASLRRAIALDPKVAEAHRTLGNIYFRQGRLAEAAEALQAELAAHPRDHKARHLLAAVFEVDGRPADAVPLLRTILRTEPQHGDARYLLGKILLAQGAATEAVQHLEAAVRLSPDEASARYQLGRAYQALGRTELADAQFEIFRQMKDKRRGKTQ